MKNLYYIIVVVLFVFFAWLKIKGNNSVSKMEEEMKNLTPEFFNQKQAKMLPKDYIKWLRKFYTLMSAEALWCKERGKVPPYLINALILTEKAIEDVQIRTGEKINIGRKVSEEFKTFENQ